MSIRELLNTYFKEYNYQLIDDYIHTQNLDQIKVFEYIKETLEGGEVGTIKQPTRYVLKILENNRSNLKKGEKYVPIAKRFQEEGFTGEQFDREVIFAIEEHAINEFPITEDFLNDINEKLIAFCKSKDNRTYKFFLQWLKSSNCPLNKVANIPYQQIEEKQRKIIEEWNNAIT